MQRQGSRPKPPPFRAIRQPSFNPEPGRMAKEVGAKVRIVNSTRRKGSGPNGSGMLRKPVT